MPIYVDVQPFTWGACRAGSLEKGQFAPSSMRVSISHPRCSGGMVVFVQGPAESTLPTNFQMQDLLWLGDRFGQRASWSGLIQAPV